MDLYEKVLKKLKSLINPEGKGTCKHDREPCERLKEVLGTGTAAVISPVGEIRHNDTLITINSGKTGAFSQKLYDEITGIQYGEKDDKFRWCHWIK